MTRKPILVLLPAAFLLTGCATLSSKFTTGVQADIGYFTDATVSMMRDANFGFSRGVALYTKEYLNMDGPEEKAFYGHVANSDHVLKAIVSYSLRLVTIAESNKSTSEQIKEYADYLNQIDVEILQALGLEPEHFNKVIKNIRKQNDILGALRAAQPIVNALGRYMEETLDKVTETSIALTVLVDKRIDAKYADVIRYQQTLEKEKSDTLKALEYVYLAVRGDETAYKLLIKSGQIHDESLIPKGKPSYGQLVKIGEYLMHKFDVFARVSKEVEPDWQRYSNTHHELNKLEVQIRNETKQFMLITLIWVRAHQKMASGKTKPAEWFDINDAPGRLIRDAIDIAL